MSNFEYSQQNPWIPEERTNAIKLLHIITLINANVKKWDFIFRPTGRPIQHLLSSFSGIVIHLLFLVEAWRQVCDGFTHIYCGGPP